MDPKATYIDLCDAIGRGDRAEARMHADNLKAWLDRGGFVPDGYDPDEFREHVDSVLRPRAGDVEACPGCGCMPGDGYTADCDDCQETLALLDGLDYTED